MRWMAVMWGLVAAPALAAPVPAVDSPPLDQAVQAAVSACSSSATVSVPLITWGGDIATVYANGGQADTAKGSLFDKHGLKLKLFREDVFAKQVQAYLTCQSPYLRGTIGMLNLAADITNRDPRTKMVVVYQMTWSAGGDALVIKENIQGAKGLRGKTIAVQAYGPHIDYVAKILADAGLALKDVKIKWVKDLTGTATTPRAAFYNADVDAAMVILPDALALTSNGTVGTGAEDSVKGARILLSTKTANRIIADVYAVRSDYFNANRAQVEAFVKGLMLGQEGLAKLVHKKGDAEYKKTIAGAAQLLLDSAQAVADTEGMYADAEFVGWNGNVKFFTDAKNPRGFTPLNSEVQQALVGLRLISKPAPLNHAKWDYAALQRGLQNPTPTEQPRFDASQVAQVVAKKSQDNTLAEGELFSFAVHFKPNQNTFSANDYADAFKRAIDLASTYGGAVITIEGHSDPLSYVKKKDAGETQLVLSRIRQSAKNLSLTRANGVRDSLIDSARARGVKLDPSQFAVVGHGIDKPLSGLCGSDPCAPKSEQDWLANMRVEFRILQVEAEANVFK